MGRYSGKTCRLICMLAMTASFCACEMVTGYITNSIALVGDSYHMLSDVIALCVGLAAVKISKWSSSGKNTFGWARAEVLGALVNSVFLIALCFTILIESLQRLFQTHEISQPNMLLIVGALGLAINLIGLTLFHDAHGHSHGHSHGDVHNHNHGDVHSHDHEDEMGHTSGDSSSRENRGFDGENTVEGAVDAAIGSINTQATSSPQPSEDVSQVSRNSRAKSSRQMNMHGVFLHLLGDALGSVIVIVSALVVKYVEADWKFKIDPAMSIVMVCIIMYSSVPLMKESGLILLQTVPTHIDIEDLRQKLLRSVDGVQAVHEFHIWQLAGNRIIASAHIRGRDPDQYMKISQDVKTFFHEEGIHSTTIQTEFVDESGGNSGAAGGAVDPDGNLSCIWECGPEKSCFQDTCCRSGSPSDEGQLRQRTAGCNNVV